MDRCVVLVDAGYLMGAAATLLAYNGLRNSVTADYGPMLASIVQEAQEQTGLPVLGISVLAFLALDIALGIRARRHQNHPPVPEPELHDASVHTTASR